MYLLTGRSTTAGGNQWTTTETLPFSTVVSPSDRFTGADGLCGSVKLSHSIYILNKIYMYVGMPACLIRNLTTRFEQIAIDARSNITQLHNNYSLEKCIKRAWWVFEITKAIAVPLSGKNCQNSKHKYHSIKCLTVQHGKGINRSRQTKTVVRKFTSRQSKFLRRIRDSTSAININGNQSERVT